MSETETRRWQVERERLEQLLVQLEELREAHNNVCDENKQPADGVAFNALLDSL